MTGTLEQDRIELTHHDPVATLHEEMTAAKVLPEATKFLPAVHALIDAEADRLPSTPPALLHRDVNTENIIVGAGTATLIDWGHPHIGDPRAEISALDEPKL